MLIGVGRLVALLSWVSALSGPTDWGRDGGGPSTTLSPGLGCGGLESKFGRGPGPSTEVEWVGLICVWGTSEACVSGYPAGMHWFMNSRVIRYDLAMI